MWVHLDVPEGGTREASTPVVKHQIRLGSFHGAYQTTRPPRTTLGCGFCSVNWLAMTCLSILDG